MIQFIIYTAKSPLNCNCTDWQGVMNIQYSLKGKSSEDMVPSFTHLFSPFALNKVLLNQFWIHTALKWATLFQSVKGLSFEEAS